KRGDIRGGISVSVPMEPLWAILRMHVLTLVLGHVLLCLMGLVGVVMGTQRLRRSERERNRAAEALQKAKERAEAATQVKSEFLANMSHELRTPLNAILGFSEIMRRDPTITPSQLENLAFISRNGTHLLDLINDVLQLSKIEAERITLDESVFNLYTLLDMLGSMFRLRVEDKGLDLMFERSPAVPRHIRCDERKLRQVFLNLLSNAAKFTEKGGISVRVGYEREEEKGKPPRPGGRLLVEVEDTGPGIAQEEIGKLFEAFSQTASGRGAQEGTGLGLTISHSFVKLMGGDIEVTSEVGRGSVFKFDVLAPEAEAETVKEIRKPRRVVGLVPGQRLPRILVVDDVEDNRRLLVKVLESMGLNAREATNGEEAISVWDAWEPQLIWMDMAMPVMNGYEATRRIKSTAKGQSTIIVALTASVLEEDRVKVFDSGCDDFIRKPFHESEIFEMMSDHLGLKYVYEEEGRWGEAAASPVVVRELAPEDLSCLPPELISNLREAASIGDINALKSLMEEVEKFDKNLSVTMRDMIDDFRIGPIVSVLKGEGQNRPREESP
ncbi:MAG: response regulator, partial [Candidatus Thermoplasmatota archaeon]|nr:response regulator [Candidatus Thermoplasmatota archaeon]